MKVAYWPGCVSRGFTPELHGSMDAGRAEARPRAGRARPRQLLRRRRDRRAQPGARRHAERAHLRDGPEGRGRRRMMNICSTCQGAQSECQERLDADADYRDARQRGPRRRRAWRYENAGRVVEQELPLAAGRGDRPRQAALAGRAPARGPADRAVLRLLHRAPDQAARLRRPPGARPVPRAASSRRSAPSRSSTPARTSAAASRSSR